jgi:cytochrome P450
VLGTGAEVARGERFGDAFQFVTGLVGLQIRTGKMAALFYRNKFAEDTKFVHNYVSDYVKKAIEQHKRFAEAGKEQPKSERYVFINELSKTGYSPKKIQDELLNILLAGRDTTASLLAHLWYILARRPDVFNKLRTEVLAIGTKRPSFEQIKEMKYLQYCMNEGQCHPIHNLTQADIILALRLHPIVPGNTREAVVDTVLPLGGGPDGKSPIFIKKGTSVNYQVWIMQRRKDLYGEDADEFIPERWETLRTG